MKKYYLMLAVAAMTLGFASCSNDDPIKTDTYEYGVTGLITKTVSGESFYDNTNGYPKFFIDYVKGSVKLELHDVKYAPMMPAQTFTLDNLSATFASSDRYSLTSGDKTYTVMEGYQVKDVRCNAHIGLFMHYLTYSVVSERGTSKVYTFPSTILSKLADDNLNYTTTTDTYFIFTSEIGNEGSYTGHLVLNNVQFSIGDRQSPKMTITIPYDEHVTLTSTKTGYIATGTGITGLYKEGNIEVPFEQSTIDNMEIVVDVVNKEYSISFDCMGGYYEKSGKLYL